jgi:hypothetical protein
MIKNWFIGYGFILMSLMSCEGYFGNKTDLDFIETPEFSIRDIAYVPIQPVLSNFESPSAVLTGFDELMYVVDEGSEEIVCLDESGRELSRLKVQGVHNLAQDRKLDLLALGTLTDTITGTPFDLTCIYRINLHGEDGYGLENARIDRTIVHPFYFKSTFSGTDASVQFTDITVLEDNRYYVSRVGTSFDPFGGPDDAVLLFDQQDRFVSTIQVSSGGALFNDYFKDPSSVCSMVQPPQIQAQGNDDFLYASKDPNGVIKVQMIQLIATDFGASYEPQIMEQDTSKADDFMTSPYKFSSPSDIALAGDNTRHIFVVDETKDSLFLFSFNGFEGVRPPAGYSSTKYVNTSFGGRGLGLMQFNQPTGVAYKNEILYVADKGNGRVLRFKLTTDFD